MLPVLHVLANAFGFASCLASRQHLVYSNASLALTLSSASRNLAGFTSSSHSLQFLLKNNANARQLLVSQESMEGVVGRLTPTSVNLTRGYFTTLSVDGLVLPSSGQETLFTLVVQDREETVQKVERHQNSLNGVENEEESRVSASVLLRRARPGPAEKEPPLVAAWLEEDFCPQEEEKCEASFWSVGFSASDLSSGLFGINLSTLGSSRPFWWHQSFPVGSRAEVSGGCWLSCCTWKTSIEAEDVAGNRQVVVLARDRPGQILTTVVTAAGGILAFLAIFGLGICICRRRYMAVSQTVV